MPHPWEVAVERERLRDIILDGSPWIESKDAFLSLDGDALFAMMVAKGAGALEAAAVFLSDGNKFSEILIERSVARSGFTIADFWVEECLSDLFLVSGELLSLSVLSQVLENPFTSSFYLALKDQALSPIAFQFLCASKPELLNFTSSSRTFHSRAGNDFPLMFKLGAYHFLLAAPAGCPVAKDLLSAMDFETLDDDLYPTVKARSFFLLTIRKHLDTRTVLNVRRSNLSLSREIENCEIEERKKAEFSFFHLSPGSATGHEIIDAIFMRHALSTNPNIPLVFAFKKGVLNDWPPQFLIKLLKTRPEEAVELLNNLSLNKLLRLQLLEGISYIFNDAAPLRAFLLNFLKKSDITKRLMWELGPVCAFYKHGFGAHDDLFGSLAWTPNSNPGFIELMIERLGSKPELVEIFESLMPTFEGTIAEFEEVVREV